MIIDLGGLDKCLEIVLCYRSQPYAWGRLTLEEVILDTLILKENLKNIYLNKIYIRVQRDGKCHKMFIISKHSKQKQKNLPKKQIFLFLKALACLSKPVSIQ